MTRIPQHNVLAAEKPGEKPARSLACIAFTERGLELAERVAEALEGQAGADGTTWKTDVAQGFGPWRVHLAAWAEDHFACDDALVIVGSAGIAVRAIAPHVRSKTSDPAVIVLDEGGNWCIPILSGHIGGANRLARRIADVAGATCVLTTATDTRGLWAVDTWACEQGLVIDNAEAIRYVSGKLLAGREVKIYSDVVITGEAPEGVALSEDAAVADVVISPWRRRDMDPGALWLIPRCLSVGIGCRRGKPEDAIQAAWKKACAGLSRAGTAVDERAVACVRSIDLKANETGLLAFCENHAWPFETFCAEELSQVTGCVSAPSQLVERVTGVDNVCERAALVRGGTIAWAKHAYDGVTVAVAVGPCDLSFVSPAQPGKTV